jgi:hypothetical protein
MKRKVELDLDQFEELLEKFTNRAKSYIKLAESEESQYDLAYYLGQQHVIEELAEIVENFEIND